MRAALVAILLALSTAQVRAWGPLGHRTIAETAALLVQDDLPATWGPLLARHRFELGVYAFLPDARFRHIDGAGGAIEAPAHVLAIDAPAGAATPAGGVDRRVAQFLRLARARLGEVRAPKGGYQRGVSAEGDARRIYLGLYELGVMSHYSGDAAMPYHATSDWNGYARGEGGIHFYFENDCVNALEPGLASDVLALARRERKRWLAGWKAEPGRPEALVHAVLVDSLATVRKVSKIDRRHAVTKLAIPLSTRDADRKPAAKGCPALRPLLVERLAKGAALTAFLWESALPSGVDFQAAADLQFSDMELAPEYLRPD